MKLNDIFKRKSAQNNAEELPTPDVGEVAALEPEELFAASLERLTPDDIAPAPEKQKLSGSDFVSELVRKLVLAVCAGIFVWSVFTLVQSFIDYRRGEELYSGISESIFSGDLAGAGHVVSLSSPSRQNPVLPDYSSRLEMTSDELAESLLQGSYNVKFEQMKSNLSYLKSINEDVFGYIHIEDTSISYPVVQGYDNDYYLDHAYTGDYMVCGSIFADCRNNTVVDKNRNLVLYGHNMNNGTMFNNVTLFLDEEFFNSHVIEFYTEDAIYTFEPFAIHRVEETYWYYDTHFGTGERFVEFCNEMQEHSNFNKGMKFDEDDTIITLSTCFNDLRTIYRYALQAKLVKVEN